MTKITVRGPEWADAPRPFYPCDNGHDDYDFVQLLEATSLFWFDGRPDEDGNAPGTEPGFYCSACFGYTKCEPGGSLQNFFELTPGGRRT